MADIIRETDEYVRYDIDFDEIVDAAQQVEAAAEGYDDLDTRLDDMDTTIAGKASATHTHASNAVTAMTGYSMPSSTSAIAASDTLNAAIGKLEKRTELNENNISLLSPTDYSTPTVSPNITLRSGGIYKVGRSVTLCVRVNVGAELAYGDTIFTGLPLPVSNTSLALNTKVIYAANDIGVNIGITREGNLVAHEAIPISAITINCTYLATQ